MPINILILKFPYRSSLGGGELHTIQLVENLRKRDFNFYLISSCPVLLLEFKKRNWNYKKIWLGIEPVTFFSALIFPLFIPYLITKLFFILLWYKINYKTKILYCLSLTEKLIGAPLAYLLRYQIFWIEHQYPERWLVQNPFLFLYRLNSYFTKIITVSKAVKTQLVKLGIKPERIKVIYNGIEIKKFQISKLKKTNSKLIIGIACRLSKEKGIDDLIKAFKIVTKKFQSLELWIAGSGPGKENLENLIKHLKLKDKVKFFGWQKDIYNFLGKLDIFALTSYRRESFGIVVAQAQLIGLPVVVTNMGGLPEVVENEKTGYIVEKRNIQAIAQALIKLITNPLLRKKMGETGKERIKRMFSQDKMLNEFEKEFQQNL